MHHIIKKIAVTPACWFCSFTGNALILQSNVQLQLADILTVTVQL